MELDVQDWLIVIGALLIVGVLLDAYRRLRNERRNPIRIGKGTIGPGDGFRERGELDPGNSELPGGGARVIVRDGMAPPEPRARAARVEPRIETPPAPAKKPKAAPRAAEPAAVPVQVADEPPAVAVAAATDTATVPAQAPQPAPETVVEIRVISRGEGGFAGTEMLRIFKECDVRYGSMKIFHRHEEARGQGAVQFSVVNLVEPGTFDPDAMDTFTTPGLGFFMRLPGPQKPLEAFDCMLETARAIAKYLDGELRDESNSVFTQQTGEHCRQRIREFALRARARR